MATREPEEDRTATMLSVAKKAVEKFRRLLGRPTTRGVDRAFDDEDLQQAALLEVLKASEESYDEFFGTPFGGFCWGIAVSAVKNALIRSRSPVSAQHRTDNLKWIDRTEIDDTFVDHRAMSPHEVAVHNELCNTVRERVRALIGDKGEDFAFAIFTGEFSQSEIASSHNEDVSDVHNLRTRVQRILRADKQLQELWKEMRT